MQSPIPNFLVGIWNGVTVQLAWIISLFNHQVHIYDVHRSGTSYDTGFVLGIVILSLLFKYGTRRLIKFSN
jgi:hypothetical protein